MGSHGRGTYGALDHLTARPWVAVSILHCNLQYLVTHTYVRTLKTPLRSKINNLRERLHFS